MQEYKVQGMKKQLADEYRKGGKFYGLWGLKAAGGGRPGLYIVMITLELATHTHLQRMVLPLCIFSRPYKLAPIISENHICF